MNQINQGTDVAVSGGASAGFFRLYTSSAGAGTSEAIRNDPPALDIEY